MTQQMYNTQHKTYTCIHIITTAYLTISFSTILHIYRINSLLTALNDSHDHSNATPIYLLIFSQLSLQTFQHTVEMSYNDEDKIVLYTTSSGGLRDTYVACLRIRQILENLHVEFEERDVFAKSSYLGEVKERLNSTQVALPQLFINGEHIGDADKVESLNETGNLKKLLIPQRIEDTNENNHGSDNDGSD